MLNNTSSINKVVFTREITEMDRREALEIIIKNEGTCKPLSSKITCTSCPLHDFCMGEDFETTKDWRRKCYEKAVTLYLEEYGKESLVEILI